MGNSAGASKERYWRKLIGQKRDPGETVAQLCAREGVSVHQFYWWKRTLRTLKRRSMPNRPAANHGTPGEDHPAPNSFVPVRLPFSTPAPSIELVHPRGWVLRLPAGFDPQSLSQILAALDPAASNTGED
jgi:hypothetical protein